MEQINSQDISNELQFFMCHQILEELVQMNLINEVERLAILDQLINYYQPELADLLR